MLKYLIRASAFNNEFGHPAICGYFRSFELESPSIFLKNMAGSRLPIIVSHGEGRVEQFADNKFIALHYVDNAGIVTESYPANPNGSALRTTGLTTPYGRFTIMMQHPERIFLSHQYSWLPDDWDREEGPWMQMFWNARGWVG